MWEYAKRSCIFLRVFQAAYLRIYFKLRYRFAAGFISKEDPSQNTRRQQRGRRLQRTNVLLVSIAVIFCISWLPLNLYNLIADMWSGMDFTSQPMKVSMGYISQIWVGGNIHLLPSLLTLLAFFWVLHMFRVSGWLSKDNSPSYILQCNHYCRFDPLV